MDAALRRLDQVSVQRRFKGAVARRVREEAGLRQIDIAQALGTTREYVSMIESGARVPAPETAERYQEILSRIVRESLSRSL